MKQSSAETHTSEKKLFMCRHEAGLSSSFITQTYSIQIHVVSSLHKREIINSLEKKQKIPTWLIYQVHIRFLHISKQM